MKLTVDASTPVVILGARNHGSLGIARSLGKLGAAVYLVNAHPRNPARFSRYCRRQFTLSTEDTEPDAIREFLIKTAERIGGRSILIPTTDDFALFAANNHGELKPWYIMPEQSALTAHLLADKYTMSETATQLGIATPAMFRPRSRSEALAFAETADFPVVVKPNRSGGAAIFIAADAAELLLQYDRIAAREEPNLILQEYIPGDDTTIWMFNGYFDANSECLFGATGQKIRQSPAYTGAACLAVCRANPSVYETTLTFMKALRYRGILDIGYRYDARDGKYKVLDVNPRIGCTFRLFAGDSGMDVARALYLDLTGQPAPPSRVPDGRKWMVEDCDLVSSLRYHRDGLLTVPAWLRSFRGVREMAFLSLRDPLPALAVAARDLGEVVSRAASRHKKMRNAVPFPTESRRAARHAE